MVEIIDGKAFAARLREEIAAQVTQLKSEHGITPGLAVILVGDDAASAVYVRNKGKACAAAGIKSFEFRLPADTYTTTLLAKIEELNTDPAVHGILVQLPLPPQIDENIIINAIAPEKDVDGFSAVNVGRLMTGQKGLVPCTPLGCIMLLKDIHKQGLSGLHAVVLGRSNIVGKPVAQLLLHENCTVTICHSRSRDIEKIACEADILIAAVGKPEMVKAGWIKPGATVIDVGINRITSYNGKTKLVGDVDFAAACEIAGAITPVPGGVGPMTIACLLQNTLIAAKWQVANGNNGEYDYPRCTSSI